MSIGRLLVMAVAAAGLAAPAPAPAAAAVQTIYLNAAGSDAASGATPATAVRTLARVQQLVAAGPADQDVEVRIHAGTYVSGGVTWDTYRPGHTISFMPDDYTVGEGRDGIAALPVFENARASGSQRYLPGYWFYACAPEAGRPLSSGGNSGLRFYYLQIQRYASGGLSLDGSAGPCGGGYQPSSGPGQPSARGLDGNTVFGMVFTSLGNAYTGGACDSADFPRCGYGGVVLTESSGNRIENNHFVNLRNTEASYIHAVYITHKSSSNRFAGNNVTGVSSDPVKVRDASNFNTFERNTFGANAWPRSSTPAVHYLEEVGASECSSYHNRFAYNDLGTYLTGSTANLPVWYLSPEGATWPGPSGCPALPSGETRLITAGNTY
ncbi:right-handed parallel beta-helix repeat-containing protein [Catenuloplanes atrovinosus]|uniref:Right handed beta helix domain-containing protein n=1 Tax=Catenuloplanes atrovinosus TaxID=137266 RepID=A0AAE3YPF8_9ACTN|nr:right-handed parallel beta-helix repeat-containing protein [Catenuloplanes atrovinosus]MDR7275988.1 hypothetical protein [Catenuloplanes atrovinosus]